MRYWPSVRSGWLDIGQILFFAFLLIKKKAKRERGLYPVILAKQDLSIYKGLIIWPKREPFLAGPALEIPRGQDGPILPAQVASQNTGLLYLARIADSPISLLYFSFNLTTK